MSDQAKPQMNWPIFHWPSEVLVARFWSILQKGQTLFPLATLGFPPCSVVPRMRRKASVRFQYLHLSVAKGPHLGLVKTWIIPLSLVVYPLVILIHSIPMFLGQIPMMKPPWFHGSPEDQLSCHQRTNSPFSGKRELSFRSCPQQLGESPGM
jgi:hypothetical protein